MAKKVEHVNTSHSVGAADMMIRVALTLLLIPQILGFHLQPPSLSCRNGATSSTPTSRSVASINENNNRPWCVQASAEGSEAEVALSARAAAATVAPPLSLPMPMLLEESPLRILDPHVRETEDGYTLTFNLPTAVTEDGLDLSVSGRLLTLEARVTSENIHKVQEGGRKGSVITRSKTQTHAAARSFILPDDVSNEVTASWVADGDVEVRLVKVGSDVATRAYFPASGRSSYGQFSSMEDSGGIPVENRRKEPKPSILPSAAEEYLSSLKSLLSSVGLDLAASESSSTRAAREQNQQRRSLLAVLDDEFRDTAKAMWTGDNAVRFPTEEQVAATVERAREERRKRVTALRRATMATNVSENEQAYVVKVALPTGATRDDVKLVVTPYNNDLRVIFFAKGNRTVLKAVHLPLDALFTEISATFTPEAVTENDREGMSDAANDRQAHGSGVAASATKTCAGVSSLEITVGRVLPQSIDIK
eukprot:g5675.t1